MENEFEKITLCGSTKFKKQFLEVQKRLSLEGKIVISVGLFGHADSEGLSVEQKTMLDEIHLRKIDMADRVYVIDVNEYIGESTQREIAYAESKGIPISYYSKENL